MGVEITDMAYPLPAEAIALPVLAFLSTLMVIVPFTWHHKNKNVGPCSLMLFVTMANFFTFINAIIWPTNDYKNWWLGYGLCDIEAKLQFSYMTGVGCATLSITRRLALAIDVDRSDVLETQGSKRRKMLIDLAICFTLPILQLVLHYIIQPNRYYIVPIGGCTASYDNSWPTIVIMFMWPLILCLLNCYYVFVIFHRLRKMRSNIHESLNSTLSRRSNLTSAQYFRLYILTITLLLIYTPVSIYFFYMNMNIAWLSYDWDAIHYPYEIWLLPVLLPLGSRTSGRWISILMSFFIFLYFGLAVDVKEIYRLWLLSLGFGRLFPGLKVRSAKEHDWTSRLSLTRRVRLYFENAAKPSTTLTANSDTDYILSSRIPSRKESFATFKHIPATSSGPSLIRPLAVNSSTSLPNPANASIVPVSASTILPPTTATARTVSDSSRSNHNADAASTSHSHAHFNYQYLTATFLISSLRNSIGVFPSRSNLKRGPDPVAENAMQLGDIDMEEYHRGPPP